MRSQYSTLTLGEEEEQAPPQGGKFAAAGLVLVALAGSAAIFSGTTSFGRPLSSVNQLTAPYNAKAGDIAPCGGPAPEPAPTPEQELAYLNTLPRWDPEYSSQDNFYNACYFSFRCCTLTGPGDGGCYVSDNFGDACRTCLQMNPPTMVHGICDMYLNDGQRACTDQIDTTECGSGTPWNADDMLAPNSTLPPPMDANASASAIASADTRTAWCNENHAADDMWTDGECPQYVEDDWLVSDLPSADDIANGISCSAACQKTYLNSLQKPTLGDYVMTMTLKTEAGGVGMLNSCWIRPGAGDVRVSGNGGYSDKCFEVISWCNLLCPRDTPQTVDHVMCKHCTLFGFRETSWDSQSFTNELTAMQINPLPADANALLLAEAGAR